MVDYLNEGARKRILDEIYSRENLDRKRESLKRYEIYNGRQERYVEEKLKGEFSVSTVKEMRKIFSVNVCPKIVDELSSIYENEPVREFSNINDDQKKQIENLYKLGKVDSKLAKAEKMSHLQLQGTIQVVPIAGVIGLRVLQPHQYDVVPTDADPEIAECYIISAFDKFDNMPPASTNGKFTVPNSDDGINQTIADPNDYRSKKARHAWWTKDFNFITDGHGRLTSDAQNTKNPIGTINFADFGGDERDYEYWIRYGSQIAEFAIDFSVLLSDTATINKLQGYAQAVFSSVNKPESLETGPNKVLWLQQDPNSPENKPEFDFATPSPDMTSSLELLEMVLRLFLSSNSIDPKTVSGKGDSNRFTSAAERMLAMIDKFKVAKKDFSTFRSVEEKIYSLIVKWSNVYQGTSDNPLIKELKVATIPEESTITVKYVEPQMVQTKSENEDSVIKRLEKGLLSRRNAIKELYGVNDDKAEEMMKEIEDEKSNQDTLPPKTNIVTPPPADDGNND